MTNNKLVMLKALVLAALSFNATADMTPPDRTTWDLYRNIDGGHGGDVIRVTNLERAGPGSLAAALAEHGKRIVVFDVAGVIDLQKKTVS